MQGRKGMERTIDGRAIATEGDFHRAVAALLGFPPYYGRNLDALWDILSTDLERPVTLIWRDAAESRRNLGPAFDRILEVLERVRKQDEAWKLDDRFEYRLD
jgi:ribonuclease inhibitor